jgi:transcriptional regulator with XRE-family HTH domain
MEEPLSYWVAVARMGFEDDFHRLFEELGISQAELARRIPASEAYVSRFLNGQRGNYELQTMTKWARAVGGVVQVRVIKEEGEAVRIVDYETARKLDSLSLQRPSESSQSMASVVNLRGWMETKGKNVRRATIPHNETGPTLPALAKNHG